MSNTPAYWNTAKKYLSKKDKVMSSLINKYKSPSEKILTTRKDVFFSLCKSIIGQQISVAAANSVFLRFKKKCKNKINAKTVNNLSFAQLKSCGLSKQKVKGIQSLSKQILDKSFNPRIISKMSDEDAILYLSQLRQIGRWSAEMILLFTYNRSNFGPFQNKGLFRPFHKTFKQKVFSVLFSCDLVFVEKYRSRTYSVLNPSITCICLSVVFLAISHPAKYSFELWHSIAFS